MQFIVFLRGINVSGQKKIKMAELREALSNAGFQGVQSYIQSGNLIVKDEGSIKEVEEKISSLIMDQYGFDVVCVARTRQDLKSILDNSPYLGTEREEKRMCFTMLKRIPEETRLKKLREVQFPPEEWTGDGTIIYGYSPNGLGKAKLTNNYFEKVLQVEATTRNLNTMRKMIELAKQD